MHPLALFTMTQMYTYNTINKNKRSVGVLLGLVEENVITIRTAFETVTIDTATGYTLDMEYLQKKTDLEREVYQDYAIVGTPSPPILKFMGQ